MSYYTSFETSLALREAGAPQEIPAGGGYWRDFEDAQYLYVTAVDREAVEDVIRSMRLDEILEALGPPKGVHRVSVSGHPDRWEAWGNGFVPTAHASSPVEAMAAVYLAVLRAAREVAR